MRDVKERVVEKEEAENKVAALDAIIDLRLYIKAVKTIHGLTVVFVTDIFGNCLSGRASLS